MLCFLIWMFLPGLLAPIHLLVAESAAAPDLPHAGSGHVLAHEVLLSLALHADQVHAPLPGARQYSQDDTKTTFPHLQ